MTTKHTPEPWGIYTTDDGERIYVTDESDLTICSFDTIFSLEINQANANLIRTAPELYEALEELADFFSDIADFSNPYAHDAINKTRAVLAKARGEL